MATLCRILSVTDHAISSPPAARSKAPRPICANAPTRYGRGSRNWPPSFRLSSRNSRRWQIRSRGALPRSAKALRPQEALYAIAPTRAQRPILSIPAGRSSGNFSRTADARYGPARLDCRPAGLGEAATIIASERKFTDARRLSRNREGGAYGLIAENLFCFSMFLPCQCGIAGPAPAAPSASPSPLTH